MGLSKFALGFLIAGILAGCGGGGGGGSVAPPVSAKIFAVGDLDGIWNCGGTYNPMIQIVGTQYYHIGSDYSYGYSFPDTLSFNQGIALGPDTVAYSGGGSLAMMLINNRVYKVAHLVAKTGFAGIYSPTPTPVGTGTEFSLNADGTLNVVEYIVRTTYDLVYGPNVGTAADQTPVNKTCTKTSLTSTPPISIPRAILKPKIVGIGYLSDVAGSQPGLTDSAGNFPVNFGGVGNITFTVGGITMYKIAAQDALYYSLKDLYQLDIFSNSGIQSSVAVQNLMAFLMVIDDDGDYGNGIQITDKVSKAAAGLTINFNQTSAAFYADPAVLSAASVLSGNTTKGTRALPTPSMVFFALLDIRPL